MIATRQQISDALLSLIDGAFQWGQPASPRFALWSKVDPSLRPAAFLLKPKEKHDRKNPQLGKREFQYQLYVYISSQPTDDPTTGGEAQFNAILDAIENALAPAGAGIPQRRNTLGGLVWHCFISGVVPLDNGDLDGDGVAIIPISVLVP